MRSFHRYFLIVLLFASSSGLTQEKVDQRIISRIKEEGFQHSQVMETLSYLTDVHGPRLLGTPGYRQAAEWARDQLAKWGLTSRLESFDENYRGWEARSFSVEMVEPRYMPLLAWPKAWVAGTDSEVIGVPVLLEHLDLDSLQQYAGQLRGKIVLLGRNEPSEPWLTPFTTRFSDETLAEAEQNLVPVPETHIGHMASKPLSERVRDNATRQQESTRWHQFFLDEGVAALIEPSRYDHGILHVSGTYFIKKDQIKPAPYFVVANEHYSRLVRLLDRGERPKLKLHLQVQFFEEPQYNVNVLADFPGSDARLRKEIVMLGAHFDSWHAGTGATDNAAGSAVVMEALRILKAIAVRPARTIRVGLWGGEEQGYCGSSAYVKQHVGDRLTGEKKAEQATLSAYFNFDNGSGKIRGIYLQGNEAVRPVFKAYLEPFDYLDATTLTIQNASWTDHEQFDALNVPAFQFIQDPLNYMTVTHHSNLDVYDYVIEDDLKQSAVILASIAYHVANRDGLLPRKRLAE
ncbi:MAG: M20/M25/M40 family metallo-hydrolase [bacterium]